MSITQTALMQQRRDTAANWTSANPTLLAGEIGIESDTNKIKIGDGSTAWASLTYRPWSQISAYPIVNADIASAAAIAYSKLATLTSGNLLVGNGSNVATSTAITGDVTLSNTGVTAIAAGVIVNADINASAAIAYSKLATLTSANIIVGSSANVATSTAVTGDISISNTGVTAIASDVIVNADINASAAIAGSKIVAATTSVVGAVQLSDSTSTTSSILAATPTAVKAAYDLANAALPKAGGTLTGNVILDNQVDARFREATANGTNYVGFQAPALVAADVLWTLPATDGTSAQVLSTNGSGTLSWATAAGGSSIIAQTQQVIGADYTLTAGYNGMSAGPVEVTATFAVTVPANATWGIL